MPMWVTSLVAVVAPHTGKIIKNGRRVFKTKLNLKQRKLKSMTSS